MWAKGPRSLWWGVSDSTSPVLMVLVASFRWPPWWLVPMCLCRHALTHHWCCWRTGTAHAPSPAPSLGIPLGQPDAMETFAGGLLPRVKAVNKSVHSVILALLLFQIFAPKCLFCVTCGFLVSLQSLCRLPADRYAVLAIRLWKLACQSWINPRNAIKIWCACWLIETRLGKQRLNLWFPFWYLHSSV